MPFELGLAVAIAAARGRRPEHEWRVLESRPYRILESLSDLNGYEVFIHGDTIDGLLRALVDMFAKSLGRAPLQSERDLKWLYRSLRRFRNGVAGSIFRPVVFQQLVVAAAAYRNVRLAANAP
jgi:hypothetical protein